jgi:hypothetical protein
LEQNSAEPARCDDEIIKHIKHIKPTDFTAMTLLPLYLEQEQL